MCSYLAHIFCKVSGNIKIVFVNQNRGIWELVNLGTTIASPGGQRKISSQIAQIQRE